MDEKNRSKKNFQMRQKNKVMEVKTPYPALLVSCPKFSGAYNFDPLYLVTQNTISRQSS